MIRRLAFAALGLLILAGTAVAQVGGKTYSGTHDAGRGGTVTLTLSGDGKRVVAYALPAVEGDTCTFKAEGDSGVWDGAEIGDGGAFSYTFYDRIELRGRFDGRTATGTIRLRRVAGSGAPACDTGSVAWSAATPGADPPPLPGATPTPVPGGNPAPRKRTVTASIAVRRKGSRISGRVNAAEGTCRSKRRLTLMNGKKVLARATTKADGTFAFKRSSRTRNKRVRVTIAAVKRSDTLTCGASASVTIRG